MISICIFSSFTHNLVVAAIRKAVVIEMRLLLIQSLSIGKCKKIAQIFFSIFIIELIRVLIFRQLFAICVERKYIILSIKNRWFMHALHACATHSLCMKIKNKMLVKLAYNAFNAITAANSIDNKRKTSA